MEDEMVTKTGTNSLIRRRLRRVTKKKLGVEMDPQINDFSILNDGTNSQIHLDLTVNLSTEDLEKILDRLGL